MADSLHADVAVIGAGIFGCLTAIKLAEAGYQVTLFDEQPEILSGATLNNHNRLHLGYHYPRSMPTVVQSQSGYTKFKAMFSDCVDTEFEKIYAIAKVGSQTSWQDYVRFCDNAHLAYEEIDASDLGLFNCAGAIRCNEGLYDLTRLRHAILAMMSKLPTIKLERATRIDHVEPETNAYSVYTHKTKRRFDIVVNAAYAGANSLISREQRSPMAYQYTLIPIVEFDSRRLGVTIMDGPFGAFIPYGFSQQFLLYHVKHSVIHEELADQLPTSWNKVGDEVHERFVAMRDAISEFYPALAEAKLAGILQGPRVLLKDSKSDDARPSYIRQLTPGYFAVLSGKVDHSVEIAEDMVTQISTYCKENR